MPAISVSRNSMRRVCLNVSGMPVSIYFVWGGLKHDYRWWERKVLRQTGQSLDGALFVGRTEVSKTPAVAAKIEIAQNTLSISNPIRKRPKFRQSPDLLRYSQSTDESEDERNSRSHRLKFKLRLFGDANLRLSLRDGFAFHFSKSSVLGSKLVRSLEGFLGFSSVDFAGE